jgi:predicted dehydrogenase
VDGVAIHKTAMKLADAGQKEPKLFSDYRNMYDMPGLEAVIIATPPHWHALHFIDACKKGLHVFLEKPVSWDIKEGQAMLKAKQESGIVVQVDFPRIVADQNKQVKEYIASGEAGAIRQVEAQIDYTEPRPVEKPIPGSFDFDTYCGPAPMQKFLCLEEQQTPRWREMFPFSRGIMFDWGIHYLHNIRDVMELELPTGVSAIGGMTSEYERSTPDHLDVQFDFNGFPVRWTHKTWGYINPLPSQRFGVLYMGEKANIFQGDRSWEVFPAGNDAESIKHESPATGKQNFLDMFNEFAEGIRWKSNEGITNTFEEALRTTSMTIYGDIAYRSRCHLELDHDNFDITNCDSARAQLKREYRVPYVHPWT